MMWDSATAVYVVAFLTGLPIGWAIGEWTERRRRTSFDAHAADALNLFTCYCGGYAVAPEDYRHTATVCGPAREWH